MFLFGLFLILALFEIVSAPIEMLWPSSIGGRAHWRGSPDEKIVALTFDDGPSRYTDRLLDELAGHQAPATFFVMGRNLDRFPETARRMTHEGHEIGNHLYDFESRPGLGKLFYPWTDTQIEETQRAVERITGTTPRYFRPPGGQLGRGLWKAVRKHDLEIILGKLPFPDPEESAEEQLETVLTNLSAGSILILHDGDDHGDSDRPATTLAMLPVLLDSLETRGYSVVSLHDLLREEKAVPGPDKDNWGWGRQAPIAD